MDEEAVPSHLPEHQRLREATRYTATVVRALLEQWFSFDSVLDLGCGTGNWLSCIAAGGHRTILGLEMEQFTSGEIEIDPGLILHLDLGQYLNLQRRFDLALCLEVAEHLEPDRASTVVENCIRHADIVLFSAALPGQQGLHHVNEQPPGYWAALFDRHDYAALDIIRPIIWNDSQIPVWYRQNLLLYVRRTSPDFTIIEARSRRTVSKTPLALAHPEYLAWFSGVALRSIDTEAALSAKIKALSEEVERLTVELNVTAKTKFKRGVARVLRRGIRVLPLPVRIALHNALVRIGLIPRSPPPPRPVVQNPAAAPLVPDEKPHVRTPSASKTIPYRIVFVSGEAFTPGHDYRVVRYAKAASAIGADSYWLDLEDYQNHQPTLRAANVIILWRAAASPATDAVIEIARKASAKILFDVDDLVFLPEIANPKIIDGIRSQNFSQARTAKLFLQFRQVMEQADACLCTTRELADQIRRLGLVAYVLLNGFDYEAFTTARHAARRWRAMRQDDLSRIGYASGSRTHQRDFGVAAEAIARVLSENKNCRLVLFRVGDTAQPLLDVSEFPCLTPVLSQIEWRDMVPLRDLPSEMARFDINLAPLETGNIFCEAKSELKYFEAALVGVSTVASPTGPMARAISHGKTGMLAANTDEWYNALSMLLRQPETAQGLARAAFVDALDRFGPDRQQDCLLAVIQELRDGPRGVRSLQLRLLRDAMANADAPALPACDVLFSTDSLRAAELTVVVPLYNYANFVLEALDSVRRQTLADLDLIVVDDASTDYSVDIVLTWMKEHAMRFNRVVLLQNKANAGLALTRNAGFDAAETAFVLPLDADNRLRPECCDMCLSALRGSSAGYAYPTIQTFGESNELTGIHDFLPSRFLAGNYVDAMALVGKWAWLRVGGYSNIQYGWEDYDFWCRCIEWGIGGVHVPEILADYRVHGASMLHTQTDIQENKKSLIANLERRHPWLRVAREAQ